MENTYFSRLKIRVGRHTRDKLGMVLGEVMAIDFRENKYFDAEHLPLAFIGCVMGHRGHIKGWVKGFSADNTSFFFPRTQFNMPTIDALVDILETTEYAQFPKVINRWILEGANMKLVHKNVANIDNGGDVKNVAFPIEKDGFFMWNLDSLWHVPLNGVRALAHALVDQELEFSFSRPISNMAGLYIAKEGKSFEVIHEDYYHPKLDIAMHRGVTGREAEEFLLQGAGAWKHLAFPEIDDDKDEFDNPLFGKSHLGVRNMGKALFALLNHLIHDYKNADGESLENDNKFWEEMSAPGALRMALATFCLVSDPRNIEEQNILSIIDRAFSVVEKLDPGFSKDAFLFFIREIMPEDATIEEIETTTAAARANRTMDPVMHYVEFDEIGGL